VNSKKHFNLHVDTLSVIDELTLEQRGELLTMMYNYHVGEEEQLPCDPITLTRVAFMSFQKQFDKDNSQHQARLESKRKSDEWRAVARSTTLNNNAKERNC